MSYAVVQDVPATWAAYLGIAETLSATCPEGLVIHAAGPTDEGFRMIGIWETRESCDRFRAERLSTILATLAIGSRLEPTCRELTVAHLLSGPSSRPALHDPGYEDTQPSGRKPHKQEDS